MTDNRQVAVVGLGNMGMGMAKNLLAAGFAVRGCDLRAERLQMLHEMGGEAAQDLTQLADSQIVFVMVMSGGQALDVVSRAGGLRECLAPGATIIITATIEPSEMREAAAALAGSGIDLIDSPVSGGQFGAESGTLTMMAAGKAEVMTRCRAALEAVGGQIFHVGEDIGMGQVIKASLQAYIGVSFVGIFEALALGARAGIPGKTLFEVFSSTHVGNSPFFKNCAQLILDRQFEDSGSHIGTMVKDLGISMQLARENSLPLFATSAAQQLFQAGISLHPNGDNWSIVQFLESFTGSEVSW
ncbi:MAG: NAD(P)-dependent oxidoreductase [Chloroflexi bacterium]|nr:NAD(P)-dependent oxidoreductase [Chloroflexota bacterium]